MARNLKIKLNKIEENSFRLCIPERLNNDLEFSLSCELLPDEKQDLFTVFLAVRYEDKGKLVLEYSASFIFHISGLDGMLEKKEGKMRVHPDFIPNLANVSFNTLRGMIAVKTMGTILSDKLLPLIDAHDFLSKLDD